MSRPADYVDAHGRHWEDAELLFDEKRFSNADQLYGFSAECGLKAVMKGLGMPVDPTTGIPRERKHLKHVQYLWPVFRAFAQRRGGTRYSRRLSSKNPFSNWSHHDRYAHRGYANKQGVGQHRDAACKIRRVVQQARQDGIS